MPRINRRSALKLGAAATALPLVHIRTGRAAGKVSIAFWDHWVPDANEVMKKQCEEFGKKHQVETRLLCSHCHAQTEFKLQVLLLLLQWMMFSRQDIRDLGRPNPNVAVGAREYKLLVFCPLAPRLAPLIGLTHCSKTGSGSARTFSSRQSHDEALPARQRRLFGTRQSLRRYRRD